MAVIQNPVIGHASGKFGNAVFSKNYRRKVLRSLAFNPTISQSPAVVLQRQKLAAVMSFLKFMQDFIALLYPGSRVNMPSLSYATSFAVKNAPSGTVDNVVVDTTKLLDSKDYLEIADLFSGVKTAPDTVTVEWDAAALAAICGSGKMLSMVLIDDATEDVYQAINADDIEAETYSFIVPGDNSSKTFTLYVVVDRQIAGENLGNELAGIVL